MGQLEQLDKDYSVGGFWKCYYRLWNTGEVINHKRLHRIYKDGDATLPKGKEMSACQSKRTTGGIREIYSHLEY